MYSATPLPSQDVLSDLVDGVLCDALAVSGAQADVLHAQFLDDLQLNVQLGIDLVGEAGDDDFLVHDCFSFRFSVLHKKPNRILCTSNKMFNFGQHKNTVLFTFTMIPYFFAIFIVKIA